MEQIGVLAFADDVKFPMDRCYMRGLSLATPTNKKKLKNEFIARIHGSISSEARYSSAFSEAFRLLATVSADADNASEPSHDQRGIFCTYCRGGVTGSLLRVVVS